MEPRARPQRGIVWQGPGKAGARYRRARGGEGNKRLRERTKQMHRLPTCRERDRATVPYERFRSQTLSSFSREGPLLT